MFVATASAQILDTVVFGDSASEGAHGITSSYTTVISGGLGQPARKIYGDPADTMYFDSGYVQVTMKCDPIADNYVTLKLWGSDHGKNSEGRVLLYQMEGGQMNQVGFRDQQVGEYVPLAWGDVFAAPIPERFYYTTIPLPLSVTQGRTSVTLRVVLADAKVKGSPGIYRMYVHQGSYFEPAPGDPQAPVPPPAPIRPPSQTSMAEAVAQERATTEAAVSRALANGGGDAAMMLKAYRDPTSVGYQNPTALTQAANGYTASIDQRCREHFANPNLAGSEWGGAYAREGNMIDELGAAGFGNRLEEVVDLGDPAGPATRRILWGKMLKAALDARFGRQGPTSAQSIICDNHLYRQNRGLLALGSVHALPESEALRYLLESAGLEPWRGSDLVGGGSAFPMGTNYYLVSPEGLTKENGYVSAYGEVYDIVANYAKLSGDQRLLDQSVKMLKGRSYLRYPMVDADGYRSFHMVGPLDWRTHQTFPIDTAYGERAGRLSVAPATNDPTAVGFAKQMFEDNQGGTLASQQMLDWEDSGIRLPMTEGQPDFAWADVDNGLVAIKRGEELTWIETYWQTRDGIHSTGRAMQITPTTARVAHIRISTQINWGGTWRAQKDAISYGNDPLPTHLGLVHQAYFNEKHLDAKNPSWGPTGRREEFAGRAQFYAARYGRYLVGINMDTTKSFELKTPPGFTSAQDLITKTTKSGTVTVGPFSAVVLDMGTNVDAAPLSGSVRYVSAKGAKVGNSVFWDTVGGATSYTVKRATTSGGPYTTLATGIGGIYPKKWGSWPSGTYEDRTAASGTTYYYTVTGVNAHGEGYPSPETAGASPAAASLNTALPDPWANVNLTISGSTTYNATTGVFRLTTSGGDIWGQNDRGHFVYRPITGDGALIARIASTGGSTKFGLALRETLAANSIQVSFLYSGGSVGAVRRDTVAENVEYSAGGASSVPVPVWLKLERQGQWVSYFTAPDSSGVAGAWTLIGTTRTDIPINSAAYIGLIAANGSPSFDRVTGPLYGNRVPAAPIALTATPGNTRVTLAWPPADQATSYTVRRAMISDGPYTDVASTLTDRSYTDTTVTNGLTYHYVVAAVNANGTGPNSPQASTSPIATAPTPTNLTVAASGTQAVLNWSASSGATSYTILRSLDGTTYTSVATGVTSTTFTNTGLAAGQTYFYSVQALNGNGASPAANAVSATSAPPVPVLQLADATGTQAKLRWETAGGATSYKVWRASTVDGPYTTIASAVTTPTYTDAALTPNADTFYKVSALNAAGESAQSTAMKLGWGTGLLGNYYNSTNFTGASALTRLDPAIVFNWGSAPPHPGMNTEFSVRWTGQLEAPITETYTFTGSADDSIQAFINGTQLVNNGSINLVAGQKYDIIVEFRDLEGAAFFNLFWSSPTIPRQNLPVSRLYPQIPGRSRSTGGTATARSQGGSERAVHAFDGNNGTKWNAGAATTTNWLQYQFAGGATWAINEYRLTSANDVPGRDPKNWELLGSNNGTQWFSLDTRTNQTFTARGQTKTYFIANPTAYAYYKLDITSNASGNANDGLQLAEFTLLSPSPLVPPPSSLTLAPASRQVNVSWSAVPTATSYVVRRSIYNGGPYTAVARVTSGTSFTDTALVNGTRYYYVVSTANAEGEGANSNQADILVAAVPTIPGNLRATAGDRQVSLQWNAAVDAATYKVFRSVTSGSGYAPLATGLSGLTYTDSTPTNGTTYYYTVAATNLNGDSPASASVSATPIGAEHVVTPTMALGSSGGSSSAQLSLATSVSGRTYQLQRSYTLAAGSWVNVGSAQPGGGALNFSDPLNAQQPKCFYRILIGP